MNKIKVMTVFGTRPEAIKMAPLVKKLEEKDEFESIVCVTAQHREMLDSVLNLFHINPKYDLNIMKHGQTITDITNRVLKGLEEVLQSEKPDILLVHGDTTTTFAASLAAFYNKIPVGHVEAGLRSNNIYSPYPEEMNRKLTSNIALFHFAPTTGNKENLLKENVNERNIFITGNTVIDALLSVVKEDYKFNNNLDNIDFKNKKVVLLTCHRRENWGEPMENIFRAVKKLALKNSDIEVVFPMHMNPIIRETAKSIMEGVDNIHLIEPLDYEPFANLMNKSYIIMTDSGGIQEEAPGLGKPVVVLRTETERPEAVEAKTVRVAGVKEDDIFNITNELINNKDEYLKMSKAINPYGDGKSSERIAHHILQYFYK
ncbi:non-hydrolyzing UDP-N-acetylglucosamine 2-epimerase [Alkalithermobacter paradoxus]|uniref:UDP-N-acetylglucosamine 2-epimerase (non-hydrolyzing) n=1 Tax=Alkalithermobacter paradoxus TaxID=29349 RepID=A0A1V4I5K7_9FIRM|nr:UDP-N-acetylglucosamine 2-epimerase [[Clostridium] thermoalcaliphilum]